MTRGDRPRAPECCDMRGMLSFLILWLLTKREMYGMEIAREIERRKGWKPNPGTIYPALRDLERRGLIRSERRGRRVFYSLTERGREGVRRACIYFCRAFGEIFEEYREICQRLWDSP